MQMLCFCAKCYAEEKITSYQVYIKVLEDSSLEVEEKIDVISEGRKIKRGIYRDFPTNYQDKRGFKYNVDFDIAAVSRDGQKEDYHTKWLNNGYRVYIGNQSSFLSQGKHSFLLNFKTNKQLGFFEEHDELYFNAIGADWEFSIENVSVTVELPKNVGKNNFKTDGFTGVQGSSSKAFRVTNITDTSVSFAVIGKLKNYEGFTIVVGWPKHIIDEPGFKENLIYFIKSLVYSIIDFVYIIKDLLYSIIESAYYIKDSLMVFVGVSLAIFAIIYGLYRWLSYFVNPKKGLIYPRFEAPKNFASYDIPFLQNMDYVPKCLSSTIISCSIKGHALIREESLMSGLGASYFIEKVDKNKEPLDYVEAAVLSCLVRDGGTIQCSRSNYLYFESAQKALTKYCEKKLSKYYNTNYSWSFSPKILKALAFCLPTKIYTPEGRAILDEIEGYKMYLDTAEKGHYGNIEFPVITEEIFESHFPYAVALGVEAKWMSAFRKALTINGQDPDSYNPTYYMGSRSWNNSIFLNNSSSSFSSVISSSSVPPGSSSGYSGGSSGGGGGGGGGGGW